MTPGSLDENACQAIFEVSIVNILTGMMKKIKMMRKKPLAQILQRSTLQQQIKTTQNINPHQKNREKDQTMKVRLVKL